jgi:hypothetical protein
MNRLEVTESLYTQVTQMWYSYLRRILQSRVVFNDMDAILGKKDDENDDDDQTNSTKLGKTIKFFSYCENFLSFSRRFIH